MKSKCIRWMPAVLLLVSLAGCGSSQSASSNQSAVTPTGASGASASAAAASFKAGPPAPPTATTVVGLPSTSARQERSNILAPIQVTANLVTGTSAFSFRCQSVSSLTVSPPGALSAAVSYDPVSSSYKPLPFDLTNVNAGAGARRGFFLVASAPVTITYSGDTDGKGDFANLSTGWNLVAFPGASLSTSGLSATQNGQAVVPIFNQIQPTFFAINPVNNSYSAQDTSSAGTIAGDRPYWIFSFGNSIVLTGGGTGPTPSPSAGASPTPNPTPTPGGNAAALVRLNQLRAQGNLPPVTEDSALSASAQLHSIWMVANNKIQHSEDLGSIGFTTAGNLSASQSNLSTTTAPDQTLIQGLNGLFGAPFHGIGFLDPLFDKTGFGQVNTSTLPSNVIRSATTINVLGSRLATPPAGTTFPLTWPANGQTIDLATYFGFESPDPLTPFPGVTAPTGAPLYIQLGTGTPVPSVTAFSLTQTGVGKVQVLEFDQNNYTNPDANEQTTGRSILAARSCIVLMARNPMVKGASYTASVTTNGQTININFTVAANALRELVTPATYR